MASSSRNGNKQKNTKILKTYVQGKSILKLIPLSVKSFLASDVSSFYSPYLPGQSVSQLVYSL